MDFYHGAFASMVMVNSFLAYRQHLHDQDTQPSKEVESESQALGMVVAARRFKRVYLPVYVLVMASDWLQVSNTDTVFSNQH